jgi:hypothetical protein
MPNYFSIIRHALMGGLPWFAAHEAGYGCGCCHLHVGCDSGSAGIQCSSEYSREGEHVVNLIGIVAPSCRTTLA